MIFLQQFRHYWKLSWLWNKTTTTNFSQFELFQILDEQKHFSSWFQDSRSSSRHSERPPRSSCCSFSSSFSESSFLLHLFIMQREFRWGLVHKAEFTHPVSECLYRNELQFFNLPWFCLINVSNKKLQRNAENACGNRMCKHNLNDVTQFLEVKALKDTSSDGKKIGA